MPFAAKVIHVTLSGQMLGGAEEWQTGFYMGQAEGDAPVPTTLFTDAVRDAWETYFETSNHVISQHYTFNQVKAARLGTDGKYDGSDVAVSFPAGSVVGGYGGQVMPPQIALVATLIAGSGKGLAGKGRMYLPGVSATVDATGHIGGTVPQLIATGLATFFNTINASFDAPGSVINASKGHKNFLGAGARNVPVNGVRVGNVYDTQRRRRNALAETYSNAVVAD
jgi:hypothetical protein